MLAGSFGDGSRTIRGRFEDDSRTAWRRKRRQTTPATPALARSLALGERARRVPGVGPGRGVPLERGTSLFARIHGETLQGRSPEPDPAESRAIAGGKRTLTDSGLHALIVKFDATIANIDARPGSARPLRSGSSPLRRATIGSVGRGGTCPLASSSRRCAASSSNGSGNDTWPAEFELDDRGAGARRRTMPGKSRPVAPWRRAVFPRPRRHGWESGHRSRPQPIAGRRPMHAPPILAVGIVSPLVSAKLKGLARRRLFTAGRREREVGGLAAAPGRSSLSCKRHPSWAGRSAGGGSQVVA
jgi:hypothetical protein